jgi:mRNA interferase RelE/StbE
MAQPYPIRFTKSAAKEFTRLPRKIQDKITEALQLLSANPFSELLKVKKLKGADALYRLRLGDYRVVYEIRKNALVILVVKIGHRREVYRGI